MKKYCVYTLLIGCCLWLTLPAGAADAELENWRTFSSPAPAQKIKVACIGDSITEGAGSTDSITKSYPAILQTLLGPGYEVRNFGSGGATLADIDPARSYLKRGSFTSSMSFDADILLIMLGTNDSNKHYPATFNALDQFTTAYDTLISQYTKGRTTPPKILIGLPAWVAAKDAIKYGMAYAHDWHFFQAIIQDRMVPMIRDYAKAHNYPIVDVNALTQGHSEWYSGDPVHPGNAGYREIAKLFFMRIQEESPQGLPTVENTRLSSLETSSATMDGNLRSAGNIPTEASLYWGTKDGGTAKGAWESSASLGRCKAGRLSLAQTKLIPGTTYYYRYLVSNSLGATWSPQTTSFTTPLADAAMFKPAGWQKKAQIKFDGYHGTGLSDFPVLIQLNSANLRGFASSQCQPGGADLRFSDSANGGNELHYEIEKWDTSTEAGTSSVWVRVRSLVAGGSIWMWWSNPKSAAPDAVFAQATWSPAYQAVWHLNDPSKDSTGHGRVLRTTQGLKGSVNDTTGVAAGAQAFGADTELECADAGLSASGPYSIMAWAKNSPEQKTNDWGAVVWHVTGAMHGLDITTAGIYRMNWFNDNVSETDLSVDSKNYHCFLSTVQTGGAVATLYRDGVTNFPVRSCSGQKLDGVFKLGNTCNKATFNGSIDEVRIMNLAVSSDYAAATYATMVHNVRSNGSGFTTYGPALSSK